MPIYDHICDHCGHAFSVVRSYSDPPVEKCPSCGKTPRRLIALPAIVFKGSGWYKTDSRPASSSSDGAKAASAETKAEAKTSDAKTSDAKTSEAKTSEAKTSEAKTSEAKTSDAKAPGKASTTAGEAAS